MIDLLQAAKDEGHNHITLFPCLSCPYIPLLLHPYLLFSPSFLHSPQSHHATIGQHGPIQFPACSVLLVSPCCIVRWGTIQYQLQSWLWGCICMRCLVSGANLGLAAHFLTLTTGSRTIADVPPRVRGVATRMQFLNFAWMSVCENHQPYPCFL